MNIDWSKAPKGATHWEPSSPRIFGSWMKNEGDSWFWWDEIGGKWRPSYTISEQRMGTFEARPQETWDGKGLPPVGTVCEAIHEDINSGKPVKAEILKHHDNGLSVAFFWVDAPVEAKGNLYWAQRFRPLRTPHDGIACRDETIKVLDEKCDRLKAENEALRRFAAEVYQVLGALDAPENVLDNASDAANGVPLRHETLLPFFADDHESMRKDAVRCRWLRERDLETIRQGGVFAGMTPENIVLNQEDLDAAIDEQERLSSLMVSEQEGGNDVSNHQ